MKHPNPSSCQPLCPNSDSRVSKRRRDARKSLPTRQRSYSSSAQCPSNGFSEEKLFELLIGKIRLREESEVAVANRQRQIEEENALLTGLNQELKSQLKTCHSHLQKALSEVEDRKSRMESWKAKLQKFKEVVNDVGHEHDCLRGEADKLKKSASCLTKEKDDLVKALDGIKIQVARAEGTIDEQKHQILASDGTITALRQGLESSQDQLHDTKMNLAEERRKVRALESYIQACALEQKRQLISMKDDQSKLLQKVDSMSASLVEETAASKDKVLSEVRTSTEDLQSSIEASCDKFRAERMAIQDFSNTAHDIATR